MSARRVAAEWESYKRAVLLPAGVAEDSAQMIETRRAFYAGAQMLFTAINTMLEPGADATEADLDNMTAIATELEDFFKLVGRRLA